MSAHYRYLVGLAQLADPGYIADVIAKEFADGTVEMVQQTTDGVAEVAFERFRQTQKYTTAVDASHHGARDLLLMAGNYAEFARAAVIGERVPQGFGPWEIPYGKTPQEYAAISAALCAAAIDVMKETN